MADRPAIFSGPMVRALLDGRKTQTRRLLTSPLAKAKIGDRLWVREAFTILPTSCYALPKTIGPDRDMSAYYRVDFDRSGKPPWRPSIHMPRWASRLTLTVTYSGGEMLQNISRADAIAEGIELRFGMWGNWDPDGKQRCGGSTDPREAYRCLWVNLNGAASWQENPIVAVLEFTVEWRNIDA